MIVEFIKITCMFVLYVLYISSYVYFGIEHHSLELQCYALFVTHGIIETGRSKITLLLQLNYGLQNSSIIAQRANCPEGTTIYLCPE